MAKLECNSGTTVDEMLDFAKKHRGKIIELHYQTFSHLEDGTCEFNTRQNKEYLALISCIKKDPTAVMGLYVISYKK